ncbi:Alpha/Beta hydrolase protein [Melanogaster broomeanus]|nr:Alpha/Beta hydrolase protein [Melanogaster broomeanus]
MPTEAPYGKWVSPITSDTVIQSNIVFDDVIVDPITSIVYHIEERPDDGGRCVIVNTATNKDLFLPNTTYNARTAVQEYGGAAAIAYNGVLYFSNFVNNRVYAVKEGSDPVPITPENDKWRYANFAVHPTQTNLLVSVLEDHTPQPVANTLCLINTETATKSNLVDGADFYATPVFNPSGTKIAWQEWYQPDMPFEGALIYIADVYIVNGGMELSNKTYVAGEKLNISVTYPTWISDITLIYTSDESNGFQNPFIYSVGTGCATAALATPIEQDFAEPAWHLGLYPYALQGDGRYGVFTAFQEGRNILYILDLTKPSDPVPISGFPYTVAQHLRPTGANTFVFTASMATAPGGVLLCTLSAPSFVPTYQVLKASATEDSVAPYSPYISPPHATMLPRGDEPLHVVFYSPTNIDYVAPTGEKPPCIVQVHGGPTSMEPQVLSWQKMYFTSRGYAWLDVNYGGSSGYGRGYIERLAGKWGIVDIQDCQDAVSILVSQGLIDGGRTAVRGGSAGGYTTLSSITLAPNPKFYKAATSTYGGITDLILLAQGTEKFELQYMYKLLGGPPDENLQTYKDRSPFYNVVNPNTGEVNITVPLLMLQGNLDSVVPKEQAHNFLQEIADNAPDEKVSSHFYDNEGHGWHLACTIKDALEREHAWYDENLL